MVRAAAKNHEHVGVFTESPPVRRRSSSEIVDDRDALRRDPPRTGARGLRAHRGLRRRRSSRGSTRTAPSARRRPTSTTWYRRRCTSRSSAPSVVRYGENPHQIGARYRVAGTTPWWDGVTQHAGSALSYLNLFDADAAWRLVHELAADAPGHVRRRDHQARQRVGRGRRRHVRRRLPKGARGRRAERLRRDHRGRRRTRRRAGVADRRRSSGRRHHRLVDPSRGGRDPGETPQGDATAERAVARTAWVCRFAPSATRRSCRTPTNCSCRSSEWKCVTTATPTERQLQDLVIAWRVCARTTSNAIVIARDGVAVGIGAGQQSRVVSADIATTEGRRVRARARPRPRTPSSPSPTVWRRLTSAGVTVGRPTGRLGARPRGDRRGERRGDRHDAHRRASLPPLGES